ncbi:hypothetical protein SH501x_001921 [Pirellulaceae bacterium SH501]
MRNKLRYRLASLFLVMSVVATICVWPQLRLSYLCWRMSNDEISISGVDIQCAGYSAIIAKEFGLKARAKLKNLLADADRFAAAHAVLAEITNVKQGGTLGPPPGRFAANNLQYGISDNGKVSIQLSDNLHLQTWWTDYVGNHTGHQIWDEESDQLVWYNEWEQNVK